MLSSSGAHPQIASSRSTTQIKTPKFKSSPSSEFQRLYLMPSKPRWGRHPTQASFEHLVKGPSIFEPRQPLSRMRKENCEILSILSFKKKKIPPQAPKYTAALFCFQAPQKKTSQTPQRPKRNSICLSPQKTQSNLPPPQNPPEPPRNQDEKFIILGPQEPLLQKESILPLSICLKVPRKSKSSSYCPKSPPDNQKAPDLTPKMRAKTPPEERF